MKNQKRNSNKKVKSVSELNGYITYFEPIFNDTEVKSISDYLRMNMH